jgi:proteasome accessory factor B
MPKEQPFGVAGTKSSLGNEASASVARKLWLLVELVRRRSITFSEYERRHERDFRTFQRDLQQLRALGQTSGFAISKIGKEKRVELTDIEPRLAAPNLEQRRLIALVESIAAALGRPIARKLKRLVGDADPEVHEDFFRFAMPKLNDESRAADIARNLERAWRNGARVCFRYSDSERGRVVERLVEPYRVVLRSGLFYLVGYDCKKRGWRMFALDRFASLPVNAGSVLAQRTVPGAYDGEDTIGFIKRDGALQTVTVELSPNVATSAISRRWQKGQRVRHLPGGSASISFDVSDAAEVVRWALGFGADARVIAPPSAVRLACDIVEQIAACYATEITAVSGEPSRAAV